MCDRQRDRQLYAELHKVLYDQGYIFQLSFYGTLKEPYDTKHVQARIEVISKRLLSVIEVNKLYQLFKVKPVDREYSLFLYDQTKLIEAKICL